VSFPYVGFPAVAEGSIEAEPPPDILPADDDDDTEAGEEGGGPDIAADRPEPGVEPETDREDRREISHLQDGREVRARDVLDVSRSAVDGRVATSGEVDKGNIASLAKRSIDDDQPRAGTPRNAATGTSGQQDALANKEQLRGPKDPIEEKGGELARREARMDFGETDQRRAGGAELGADGMARGSDDLDMDMD